MRGRFFALLLGAWLVLCAAGATHAQSLPERRTMIGTGRFWGSMQVELLSVRDRSHRTIFGGDAQQYTFEAGARLVENLDLLGSVGYRLDSGNQIASTGPGAPAFLLTNKDNLHIIPMTASLRYRLQWDPEFWLVPYVRGGMTGAWFIYDEDTLGAKKVWGIKWGVHGGGGLLWRIDELDKNSRRSLRGQGIDAMYLDTAFYLQSVHNFGGKGFDFSGMGARLGLTIWVR